jgi:hypothetical protein
MRKTLVTLLAIASSVAAFGSVTGVAAADAPSHTYQTDAYSGPGYVNYGWGCYTNPAVGNLYQAGAWGYYVDGCTTPRLDCPYSSTRGCTIVGRSDIKVNHYEQVTMNSRVRVFNSAAQVTRWYDQSCISQTGACSITHGDVTIAPGESATTQCNGVHAYTGYGSYFTAVDTCRVHIRSI